VAHAVETMFFTGEVPWHRLGRKVEEAPTSEDAMVAAGLDWRVDLRPVFAEVSEGGRSHRVYVPEHFAVVRDRDRRALGVVGRRYAPVQNAEAFSFVDAVVGTGDVRFESAGSLEGGKLVWLLARLPRDAFEVVQGDEVVPYLLLGNRHDGGGSLVSSLCSTRVVCANTFTAALAERKARIYVRHVGRVSDRVSEAQVVLGLARAEIALQRETFERCRLVVLDGGRLERFASDVYPDPEEDAAEATRTRIANRRENLVRLFEEAPGNALPGVRGTGWAALSAVTYLTTHEAKVRGRAKDARSDDERRLASSWYGSGATLNARAVESVLRLAA